MFYFFIQFMPISEAHLMLNHLWPGSLLFPIIRVLKSPFSENLGEFLITNCYINCFILTASLSTGIAHNYVSCMKYERQIIVATSNCSYSSVKMF